ncbi:hypothetical protein BCU36_003985 [Vibrio lentus]|uniref:hypothetical protein n=1 Tax=Vibrio lentus TaxID=136468 RepID=UPI000C858E4A|nr:hypothetical protein [Vibrio lentus]PMI54501.1 hypothetical protein BCU43_17225 [Vibrio lentus]PMI83468.1 hypothetical protein BCU36_23335 [Vibrio lentus]
MINKKLTAQKEGKSVNKPTTNVKAKPIDTSNTSFELGIKVQLYSNKASSTKQLTSDDDYFCKSIIESKILSFVASVVTIAVFVLGIF